MEKTESDKNIDESEIAENPLCEARPNVVIPSMAKHVKYGHMKMAGYGVIASSDLCFIGHISRCDGYQFQSDFEWNKYWYT